MQANSCQVQKTADQLIEHPILNLDDFWAVAFLAGESGIQIPKAVKILYRIMYTSWMELYINLLYGFF